MFLWLLSSTGIIWCICVYYGMFCWIWIVQYRCLDNWFLECQESIVMGWCPLKFCLLVSQECQRLGYFGKVPDKFPIISDESKKCMYFFGCFWWMHVFMAWVFDGRGLMPLVLRIYPSHVISLVKKWHLLHFIDRCAFLNFSQTCFMWSRCFSTVLLKIMSSR